MPSPHGRLHQQSKKNYIEKVAGKNVRKETNRQGKNARRGADEFDGKKQDAQQPVTQAPGRTSKREQVMSNPMMANSLPVEIQKNDDGAAERNRFFRRGRRKGREKAQQIGEQNEHGNRSDHRHVTPSAVLYIFIEQIADSESNWVGNQQFRDLLHPAGIVHGKPRAQPERAQDADHEHHEGHDNMLRYRCGGIRRLNVQRAQQPKRKTGILKKIKITYTDTAIKKYRPINPNRFASGTRALEGSAWAVAARATASRALFSHRKLTHASSAPIRTPAPTRMENRKHPPAEAIPPRTRVRRAMRRSVSAYGPKSTVPITTLSEPPQNVTNTCVKTHSTKNKHENGLGVQPSVKQVAEEAADNNRGNQEKR